MLPARAALLLHCHAVLARPRVDYGDLLDVEDCLPAALTAQLRPHGRDTEPAPAGRTPGGHMLAAAALADGLLTYWGMARTGADGGGSGAQAAGPPPTTTTPLLLLSSELAVLASVVSSAQVRWRRVLGEYAYVAHRMYRITAPCTQQGVPRCCGCWAC